MLDIHEDMKLSRKQFERQCVEIGWKGKTSAVWHFLDPFNTGIIGLVELLPKAASTLGILKSYVRVQHGDKISEAFKCLFKRSVSISKPEFIAALRSAGIDTDGGKLFDLLDRQSLHHLTQRDFDFLSRWHPPPYVLCQPDDEKLSKMKQRLGSAESNAFGQWCKFLSLGGNMQLSWDGFNYACAEVAEVRRSIGQDVAGVWRALDRSLSGVISLKAWDANAHAQVAGFKAWACQNYGSCAKAMRVFDSTGSFGMCAENRGVDPNVEMRCAKHWMLQRCSGHEPCRVDLNFLFDGLGANSGSMALEDEFKFLDNWDEDWDEWISAAQLYLASLY